MLRRTLFGLTAAALLGSVSLPALAQTIELELFQTKFEAVATYDALIAEFEALHPEINIEAVSPPDANTVIATRLAKGDLPDIFAIQGDSGLAPLIDSGVLIDFTQDPLLANVQPDFIQSMKNLDSVNGGQTVWALPWAKNAMGIFYNKDVFAELGLSVPTTWDELVATADKIKAAGKIPFALTGKYTWSMGLPFFNIGQNTNNEDWVAKRFANEVTFADSYKPAAEELATLFSYAQPDLAGPDGNEVLRMFASGEAAMMIDGVWSIPTHLEAYPDLEHGFTNLPSTNDPARNKFVGGLDVVIAVPKDNPNQDAIRLFVEFLMQPESAQRFADEQRQFMSITGVEQRDPILADAGAMIANGMLADYPVVNMPPNMDINGPLAVFLQDRNVDAFLASLDQSWDGAIARR